MLPGSNDIEMICANYIFSLILRFDEFENLACALEGSNFGNCGRGGVVSASVGGKLVSARCLISICPPICLEQTAEIPCAAHAQFPNSGYLPVDRWCRMRWLQLQPEASVAIERYAG